MAIWPEDRETISCEEFLGECAKHDIDCRLVGGKLIIYTSYTKRTRDGEMISSQEAVDYVRAWTYRDEPILRFIRSKRFPGMVSVAFSDIGWVAWQLQRAWKNRILPDIPRRFRRGGRSNAQG